MSTLTLYEIPDRLRVLEAQIIEAAGEITPEIEAELDALEEAFERKVEYIALLSREAKAEAAAVRQEEDRLAARRKAAENRERRLKDYLHACMTLAEVERVEGDRAKVRIQANSQPSIAWLGDDDAIPEAYRVVSVRPDLSRARDEHKAGAELPEGFQVTQGSHVRIS